MSLPRNLLYSILVSRCAFILLAVNTSHVGEVSSNSTILEYTVGVFYTSNRSKEVTSAAFASSQNQTAPYILIPYFINLDQNTYRATLLGCELFSDQNNLLAVLGPDLPLADRMLRTLMETYDVPYLSTYQTQMESGDEYFPTPNLMSGEYKAAYINDYTASENWSQFTFLYEDDSALSRLRKLFYPNYRKPGPGVKDEEIHRRLTNYQVFVHKLPASDQALRSSLLGLKESVVARYVVDCAVERIPAFLDAAQGVNMLTSYYHYVFSALDADTLDYDKYYANEANITVFGLNDRENYQKMWLERNVLPPPDSAWSETFVNITVPEMLLYDTTILLYRAADLLITRNYSTPTFPWIRNQSCLVDPPSKKESPILFSTMENLGNNVRIGWTHTHFYRREFFVTLANGISS